MAARPGVLTTTLLAAIAIATATACRRKETPRVVAVDPDRSVLRRAAPPRGAEARKRERTIEVGRTARRYLQIEPASLDPARPLALVLVFHGDGGTAASFHAGYPFERASGDGALVLYPEGRSRTWDIESTNGNVDIAFVDALVAAIAKERPIDRGRVFATGYSSGGFFANVLACQRPGLLRAISSSAGGAPYNQAQKWPNGYPKCPGQVPVAAIALHGENDLGVTLDSGRFSAEYWAYVNGCRTDEMETTAYTECRAFRGCPPDKAVVFCAVPGLDHWVWDEAAAVSWTFFLR